MKCQLFKGSRKGTNDVSIMIVILMIFLGTAIILPFMNESFGTSRPNIDTGGLTDNINEDTTVTTLSAGIVVRNIFKLAFWSFGDLPFWLDAFFTTLAITWFVLLYRQLRSGGG